MCGRCGKVRGFFGDFGFLLKRRYRLGFLLGRVPSSCSCCCAPNDYALGNGVTVLQINITNGIVQTESEVECLGSQSPRRIEHDLFMLNLLLSVA